MFRSLVIFLFMWCEGQLHTEKECSKCRRQNSFQNQMCDPSVTWAMHVKVTDVLVENEFLRRYKAELIELFKPQNVPQALLTPDVKLETSGAEACGTPLKVNRQYIVSGVVREEGTLLMDMCTSMYHLITQDFPLSDLLLENLRTGFLDNCRCEVVVMTGDELANFDVEKRKKKKQCIESEVNIECTNHLTVCRYIRPEGGKKKECLFKEVARDDVLNICTIKNWAIIPIGGRQG